MAEIDVEDENILTSIFKDAFPESWQDNPEFVKYLVELSSHGVQKLAQEPDRLAEEKSQILEETQDLAFHNYTTFIQTANCSKEIFQDFQIIEQHLDDLLGKLPPFAEECNKVLKKAQEISSSRRMNTLTLQRHTQLLEVLEMPQLMDTCVRNAYYEEALELAAHVRRLEKKHSNIPVVMSIVEEVKASTQLMLGQLIQQLRSNLQLPACLRVIGYLRRMEVFSEPELRIKFLQARDSWFQSILDAIPKDDPYTHITKTIEASRVHLFDIMTQFRAIFSDEDPIVSASREDIVPDSALFHSWVVQKVSQFLSTLDIDLNRGVGGRLDSLLGQCMYFGLSFSRVGADFRGLVAPVFQRAALRYFEEAMKEANKKFEENMQSYNLLGITSSGGMTYGSASQAGQLYPPTILLDFYPLAAYCNHLLTSFNELRLCAPVNLACQVVAALNASLLDLNRVILAFHRAEETTFNQKERAQFEQFCATYATDLLPYLNRCLQALFPAAQLAQTLGISATELNRMGNIGMVDLNPVLQQVQHLMPVVKEEPPELPPPSSPPATQKQPPSSSSPPPVSEESSADNNAQQRVVFSLEPEPEDTPVVPDTQPTTAAPQDLGAVATVTSQDITTASPNLPSEDPTTPTSLPQATTATTTSSETASATQQAKAEDFTTQSSFQESTTASTSSSEAAAATQEATASADSGWLDSDDIDLDAMPDAWLSAGDAVSGAGEGIDVGLASDLAAGLMLEGGGVGGGKSDVKKQD
ncbi:conserved oligomeric Golgi complex subunit 8-like [Littorina saxatilis]|uniref:Conserved oligomeric Golgi complex subunit 8 n=1 Tax=Littorina saxatilis TaxID=31220 RepID=A0AAN9GFV7_9CAEN